MKWGRALALAVVALLLASAPARAQGRRLIDAPSGVDRTQHGPGHRDGLRDSRRDDRHGNGHQHHRHPVPGSTIFFPFGFFSGVVYPAPTYYAPAPAVAYAPPSMAPPLVRVVYYSTGRYVLYGDGMTSAYQWVWIPNAPPAPPPPPSGAPPAPPPDPPSAAPEPKQAPSAPRELWTWTDEQGTAHWTDRRDNIPEHYRVAAQRRG